MTIVKFNFDKEKDLKNIWETANSDVTYGYNFKKNLTNNIIQICEGKKYKKIKPKLKRTMKHIHNNILCKEVTESYNKVWKNIEKEYFERLEKITKWRFPFKKLNAYLTTAGRCPYDPDKNHPSFFVNFFSNIPIAMETAGHEIMHIHLHNSPYWNSTKKQIGKEKTHDLKEALTELLNSEFRDLWMIEDKGYPSHIKLRKFIKEQWKKKKNFDVLVDKSIQWIKKNEIK